MSTAQAEVIERAGRAPVEALAAGRRAIRVPGHPHDLRRCGGGRPRRGPDQPGGGGLPDHQLDDDGRRVQRRDDERAEEPLGRRADVLRAGERALGGDGLRGVRRRRGPGHQLHLRPGAGPHEGGLYTISGKRLPVVMNIGARALTSQGLNVHAGHDDVMSVADCGWGMIFARNAAGGRRLLPDLPPRRRGHPDARSSTSRTGSSRRTPSRPPGSPSSSS